MRIHVFLLAGTMLATLSLLTVSPATAHVSLERAEAEVGSFKAVMRIAHDLDYPAATLKVAASTSVAGGHGHEDGSDSSINADGGPVMVGDLTISDYWTRATLPNQRVGGGYFVVENTGTADDRLVAATSPVTERAEFHEMSVENDVMTMRRLDDGIVIPAGESLTFEPGGYHLMFQDLAEGFVEGETVSVTLQFENAGEVTLDLPVQPAGSREAGGAPQH